MRIVRAMKQLTRLIAFAARLRGMLSRCSSRAPSRRRATPTTSAPPLPAAPDCRPRPTPARSNDQASYLFGLTFGEQLHSIGIASEVIRGRHHARHQGWLQGKKSTPAERQQMQEYACIP